MLHLVAELVLGLWSVTINHNLSGEKATLKAIVFVS